MAAWHETALMLKRQNPEMTNAEIARRCGVTKSAAWKALHPDKVAQINRHDAARRGPQKRAWERAHRMTCSRCGELMQQGSAKADGSRSAKVVGDVCATCLSKHRALLALKMVELRRHEDLSNHEIAGRLGIPVGTVTSETTRLRSLGIDVPLTAYARRMGRKPRAAAFSKDALSLGRALQAQGVDVPALNAEKRAA